MASSLTDEGCQNPPFPLEGLIRSGCRHSLTQCVHLFTPFKRNWLEKLQGNSLLRGPEDVVVKILQTLSPRFDPNVAGSVPAVPCGMAPALAFQIGGQVSHRTVHGLSIRLKFGVRCFQLTLAILSANWIQKMLLSVKRTILCPPIHRVTVTCSVGALELHFLGRMYFIGANIKDTHWHQNLSNLVVFHYGNLTHPSVDPPRIGLRSNVPANANLLMREAVKIATKKGATLHGGLYYLAYIWLVGWIFISSADENDPAIELVDNNKATTQFTFTSLPPTLEQGQDTTISNQSSVQNAVGYLPILIQAAILLTFYI